MLQEKRDLPDERPQGMSDTGKLYSVLVVDDSKSLRSLVIQVLTGQKYMIAGEAGTGEEAVAKYKDTNPDVVVLDVNMPGMNGLEALKEIRAMDENARIVMMTTESTKDIIVEAVRNGAKGYIVKPCPRHKILKAVKKALDT